VQLILLRSPTFVAHTQHDLVHADRTSNAQQGDGRRHDLTPFRARQIGSMNAGERGNRGLREAAPKSQSSQKQSGAL